MEIHPELLLKVSGEGLTVPLAGLAQTGLGRGVSEHVLNSRHLRVIQASRSSLTRAFGQSGEPLGFEPLHPVLHGARGVAQNSSRMWAGHALGDQQYAMQAVVVARLLRSAYLVLKGQDHVVTVRDR